MTSDLVPPIAEEENPNADLARRARSTRKAKGMTLSDVEANSGITASTISKIENGVISPSYANLIRLSKGLGIDIVDLVREQPKQTLKTRRSITRFGDGPVHSIGTHDYHLLCSDLTSKKMQPMLARIHAQSMHELKAKPQMTDGNESQLFSHQGEEVLFVHSGEVILHTEHYAPVHLAAGDCAYIDSSMGHICLRGSDEDAFVFWVCSDGEDIPWE
ncbi:XRE family transcriptional regulator [uncultured Ruegeria sp.]|uniref:helix-turn-helix domain-containing protein n=1 Tax=uncultured Ruegeria sp. TaxID=259304 RepID=UPI00263271D4|nr:XRE family transcriptional regulator [uncultured Ruegeria sp.]